MITNIEFKARSTQNEQLEQLLEPFSPSFIGEDLQTDTYFLVPYGRLKLREGTIENALIHYQRSNTAGAKQSNVLLYRHSPDKSLKEILTVALGIKTVVVKRRRIWFVENVKFHFDLVEGLGTFVEVEAIDTNGTLGKEKLQQQCAFYQQLFGIRPEDFVAESYSDLLLQQQSSHTTPHR